MKDNKVVEPTENYLSSSFADKTFKNVLRGGLLNVLCFIIYLGSL
jgi:hypothetical protein